MQSHIYNSHFVVSVSDPFKSWCESLGNALKDLHVPDLSVCDSLIAREFLSDDDCQVINKTKRNKSKIKRLISILSNSKDPRAAFYALSECIAKTHGHLVEQVRAAADCFPRSDINSNFHRSPVEHDETHTLGYTNDFSHHPEVINRGAVQHDEDTHSVCIPERQALDSVAQPICSNCEASIYYSHKTNAKSTYLDNVNENRDPDNHIHSSRLISNKPDEHSSNDTFICSPVSQNSSQACIVPTTHYTGEYNDITTDDKHQFDDYSHAFSERFSTETSLGFPPTTSSTSHIYDNVSDKSHSGSLNDPYVFLTNSLQNTNNRISQKIPSPKSHFDNRDSMRRLDYVDGDWVNDVPAIGNNDCLDAVDGAVNFNDKRNEPVEDSFTISECGKSSTNSKLEIPDKFYENDTPSLFRENSKEDENVSFSGACCIHNETPVFDSFLGDSPPHDSGITRKEYKNDINYVSGLHKSEDIDCNPSTFHVAGSYTISSKVLPDDYERTRHTPSQDNLPPHSYQCSFISNSNCNQISSEKPLIYEHSRFQTGKVKHNPVGISEVKTDMSLSNVIPCQKSESLSYVSSLQRDESPVFKKISSVPNCESQNGLSFQPLFKQESHFHSLSSTESRINDTSPDKFALSNTDTNMNKTILRDRCKQNQRSTNSKMSVDSMLSSQRALSQIDFCPSLVLDTPINRAQSWAAPRTRKSWLYSNMSSCSEDYTTTDINSSDLNEVELELCDKLEKSGSITDVVDRLIQEEYLSNDDCNAIKDIQVKRHQAMYVAKRISSLIGDNRCKTFSQLLEYQPKLSEWLSLKFIDYDDCNHKTGISTKNRSNSQTENRSYASYTQTQCETKCKMQISPDSCMRSSSSDSDDSIVTDKEHNHNIVVKVSHALCPADVVVDKTFQKVFDALNNEFNKGTLPITTLPRESNTKCIVLYLKACDALYKAEYEDAERFIKLADAAVYDTMCPLFMRSEIFTQKTWLCLRTNRLGLMENLLVENEQFLLANPNLWSNKAVGWFYYDYGRFYVTMVKISKPLQRCRRMKAIHRSVKAYEIYQERAKRCLRKSIDYFSQSNSSDGPIGMGFSLSLLASIELQCVSEETISDIIDTTSIQEAEKLLKTVTTLFDDVPGILKATYLQSESDLYLRKGKITEAQATIEEGIALCKELDLKDDLKDSLHKQKLLNRVFHTSAHY